MLFDCTKGCLKVQVMIINLIIFNIHRELKKNYFLLRKMKMTFVNKSVHYFILFIFVCSSFAANAKNEILFEGYHKILSGKQHAGYTISRYEHDPVSKKFFVTIFVKLGALAGNAMESIKAESDESMVPISYDYTTLVTENNKTITKNIVAKFSKVKAIVKKPGSSSKNAKPEDVLRMTATVSENGVPKKIIEDLPKGTFLSYFLVYMMLKSKEGIQTSSKYSYKAIAEEKAQVVDGSATVRTQEDFKGFKTFRVDNKFNDQEFVSFVTDQGHVIGVVNPAQSIETELMAKPKDAVAEFNLPTTVLKSLFGEVPLGTNNIASARLQADALKSVTEPPGSKAWGTPAKSGIQSKTQDFQTKQEPITEPTVERIEKDFPKEKK